MKVWTTKLLRSICDVRAAIIVGGIVVSVAAHELFHIVVHAGEISRIRLLPDMHTIVEVVLFPSASYDILFEESVGYGLTLLVMLLTALLVAEVHDAKDERSVLQTLYTAKSAPETKEDIEGSLQFLRKVLDPSS